MKSIKIVVSILAGLFFLASCEKEIIFNGEITDPMVVVNSYITPDSVISANITLSRFFLNDSTSFREISNADVSVMVNGVFKEKMNYINNGQYKGTYKPLIGQTIKLIVKVPNKKEVTCEALIEPKPDIMSLDTTDLWTGTRYIIQYNYTGGVPNATGNDTMGVVSGHLIKYTLNFKDNPDVRNYYRLVVLTKEYYSIVNKMTNDTIIDIRDNYSFAFNDVVSRNGANSDPLSIVGGASNNMYNVFQDDLFNGKTYSLTFETNEDVYRYAPKYQYGQEFPFKKKVIVYLQSITRDYYLYLKSRPVALNGTDFFSEAVQIHNNITGGIGILGSYTLGDVYTLELK